MCFIQAQHACVNQVCFIQAQQACVNQVCFIQAQQACVNQVCFIQAHKLEKAGAILPLYVKLAKFLTDIGEYDTSEGLLSDVITRVEKECGEKSQLLCEPLLAMVTMLNVEGRRSVKPH